MKKALKNRIDLALMSKDDLVNRVEHLEFQVSIMRRAIEGNTNRKAFKENGVWFIPLNEDPLSAEQISAPRHELYEALHEIV